MAAPSRKALLCAQTTKVITGIEFVQILDPTVQTVLHIFFVIDPDKTVPPLATAADLANPANTAPNIGIDLVALNGEPAPLVVGKRWVSVTVGGITRACLEIIVDRPGGFVPYRLTLHHIKPATDPNQIDPFLGTIVFDFKQACETGFDCRAEHVCTPDPGVDFPVDYLARDFESFRTALHDFAAQRYPEWAEAIEADFATMMLEIMAALGDDCSWQQDRNDAEARFGSATQRASLFHHARLVDYFPDRGAAAGGPVRLVALTGGTLAADSLFWAASESSDPVPFTVDAPVWVHPSWNTLRYHGSDPELDCIAKGASSLLVVAPAPVAGDTPLGLSRPDFLKARLGLILSDPADPSKGRKAWPITIQSAVELADPLILTSGNPTPLLLIQFADPVPFDLPVDGLTLALNVATVTAGRVVTEFARAGNDQDLNSKYPTMLPLAMSRLLTVPRLIEREGPIDLTSQARSRIARIGLLGTEDSSLRFPRDGSDPVAITEMVPPAAFVAPIPTDLVEFMALFAPGPAYPYFDDLLTMDLDSDGFTVEPGMWRTVATFQRIGGDFAFRDYATDRGWSVKWGFGDFGRPPDDASVLQIAYHTDPGTRGNIPSFALALSVFNGPDPDPGVTGLLSAVENPLPFNNARSEEDARSIRRNAPQAWRANPRRAVRPEDYSAIIEKLPWVQQAYATTRWTGSWPTDFIAADPLGSADLTSDERRSLIREIDCIRLATRDARAVDASYRDIDIDIVVCIVAGFDESRALKAVRAALAPPGFFDPYNFTFGQPLFRSALEAAVQAVPGIAHVEAIRIRVLDGRDPGRGKWRDFTEARLDAGPDQIIRLQNDPDRSTLGLLTVHSHGALV